MPERISMAIIWCFGGGVLWLFSCGCFRCGGVFCVGIFCVSGCGGGCFCVGYGFVLFVVFYADND